MKYDFSEKVKGLQASAIREILKFTAFPDVISFAAGNPSPEAFPIDEIKLISQEILNDNPVSALQYNITEGYAPLRDLMKNRMNEQACYNESADDLIITAGAQQAAELSCKALCNEGDTIICEAPTFIGSLNAFRSYKVNLTGIEMKSGGIDIELLENALKTHPAVRLLYLIPNFHNPTGNTMPLEKRKAVYELAKKYNIIIFEDNPYNELRFKGDDIPPIKSLDTDGRVIYAGSFSKILAPGLRVGFVSAPKEIIQKLVVCKQVSDVHTNIWAQIVCERFMATADLHAHFNRLKSIYKKKCDLMLSQIDKHFPADVSCTRPEGGMFLWVTMPDGSDMLDFCRKAVSEHKVAVVPGTAFMISEADKCNSFRMNFSTPSDEQIVKGCEILGKIL